MNNLQKKIFTGFFLFALIFQLHVCSVWGRTWTYSGRSMEAVLLATVSDDGSTKAVLRLSNSELLEIPVEELSEVDRRYINENPSGMHAAESGDKSINEESVQGKKYALLIGVNRYKNLRSLHYCENDVRVLGQTLTENGFSPENIYILDGSSSNQNLLPTRNNIVHILEVFSKMLQPDDVFLVMFSGHGCQIGDEAFLCPCDMDRDPKSMLPRTWIYQQLENTRSSYCIFIIDACRDTPFLPGSGSGDVQPLSTLLLSAPGKLYCLSSCEQGQKSVESAQLQHGIFTYCLIEALRGCGDTDEDGWVSLQDAYTYVRLRIPEVSKEVLGAPVRKQTPLLNAPWGDHDPVLTEAKEHEVPPIQRFILPTGKDFQVKTDDFSMDFLQIASAPLEIRLPFIPDRLEQDAGTRDSRHWVKIDRPYYISKTEVTQAQYEAVLKQNPSKFVGPNRPVENVSFREAKAFIEAMNTQIPLHSAWEFALPTPEEWEFAYYQSSDNIPSDPRRPDPENFDETVCCRENSNGETCDVTQKQAFHGLYGMLGNVWEWCNLDGLSGVVKGGGFDMRKGARYFHPAESRIQEENTSVQGVGLRIVLRKREEM